jgi:ketosteroid isomerase-like protein
VTDASDAIRRAIALYGQLVDEKRFAEWGDLFTEDARFVARGQQFTGRAVIVETIGSMMATPITKHLAGIPVVDVDSELAKAWTDLTTFVTGESGIAVVTTGRYYDEFRLDRDGRWRFTARVLVMAGDPVPDDVARSPAR